MLGRAAHGRVRQQDGPDRLGPGPLRADQVRLHGVRRPAERARHHVHPHLGPAGRQRGAALRAHVVVRRLAAAEPPGVGLHRQRRELHRPPLPGAVRHPEPDAGEPRLPGLRRDGGQRRAAPGGRRAGHADRARPRASPPSPRRTARWPRRSRPWRSSSRWRTTSRCPGATSCAGPTTGRRCRTTSRRRCAGWTSAPRWPRAAPTCSSTAPGRCGRRRRPCTTGSTSTACTATRRPTTLELNEVGRLTFRCTEPLLVDDYTTQPLTGSFIIIDPITNATVGAGVIRVIADRARQPQRGAPRGGRLSRQDRFAALGTRGRRSCSPGCPASGKSTLAAGVEEALRAHRAARLPARRGQPAPRAERRPRLLRPGPHRERAPGRRGGGDVRRGGLAGAHRADLPVRGGPPAHPLPARAGRAAPSPRSSSTPPSRSASGATPRASTPGPGPGSCPGFTGIDSAYEVPLRS